MHRRADDRRAGARCARRGRARPAPRVARSGSMRVPSPGPHAGRDLVAGIRDRHLALDRVVVGLLVLFEVADVGPVRVEDRSRRASRPRAASAERDPSRNRRSAALHAVEDRRLEHVDAGVDRVGEDFAPRRLLEKAHDRPVLVGDDDAELERVGDALQRDRDVVALLAVMADERVRSTSVSASPLMIRNGSPASRSCAILTAPAVPSGVSSTT